MIIMRFIFIILLINLFVKIYTTISLYIRHKKLSNIRKSLSSELITILNSDGYLNNEKKHILIKSLIIC